MFSLSATCFYFSFTNKNSRDSSINFFFFSQILYFNAFFITLTPGKFRNVKIIFELNYTGRVTVIVRRGWGSPLQNLNFQCSFQVFTFPRQYPSHVLLFLLASTSSKCKYIGLFQLYFIVNLILIAF